MHQNIFFRKLISIRRIYWCLKRISSVIIEFIVSLDDTASFCFALNKSMILERNCAISLVVHFEESLVSWSWNYQFIVGFTASLGIKIISKETMINTKRSKCGWSVFIRCMILKDINLVPRNGESKLHFLT